jgi:hypothetical protein
MFPPAAEPLRPLKRWHEQLCRPTWTRPANRSDEESYSSERNQEGSIDRRLEEMYPD